MIKTEYKLDYQIFENKNNEDKTKPQIWFAFHGIGQNTDAFKHFANQNNSKVYSFSLFYHEKIYTQKSKADTENKQETTLKNWLVLMQQFLEKEALTFQINSINIIGFSLGVRAALQFISHFCSKNNLVSINEIILIAPETLAISNWYRFGTQTILGKFLLKKVASLDSFKEIILFFSSFIFSKNAHQLIRHQIYVGINSLVCAWIAYRSFEIYGKDWQKIDTIYKDKITILASQNDNFVKLNKIRNFVKKNSLDKGKSIKWIISKSAHARLLKEFRI